MSAKKFLIVIGGPTASGKTGLAIRLARHFGTQILSADSRQFFREMNIGTAKPSQEELAAAPHHFIGHLSIRDHYSGGDFERDALAKLAEIFQETNLAIVVGGSGLYLKALCEGLDQFPEVPTSVRHEVETLYQEQGLPALQQELAEADPEYFALVDRQNPHRLIRALTVCRTTGRTFSSFRRQAAAERVFTPIYLQTHWPREVLYERINQRVDAMIREGLLEEASELYQYRAHTTLQTVGYQELFDYLEGKLDWQTAVELIKRNSRRYAKRQLTWLRRDGYWPHFHPAQWTEILHYLHLAMTHGWHWQTGSPVHEPLLPPPVIPGERTISLLAGSQTLATAGLLGREKESFLRGPFFSDPGPSPELTRIFIRETVFRLEENSAWVFTTAPYLTQFEELGFTAQTSSRPPALDKYLQKIPEAQEVLFRK